MVEYGVHPDWIAIDVDLGAGWVELEDVQISSPIQISRGIQGTSQKDRVASTGSMSFMLNNAEDNSQAKIGLYSQNHVNALSGWRIGIPVRCVITYRDADYTVFVGTIAAIEPTSGRWGERKVNVSCVDWMEEAAQAKVSGLEIQLDKRSDEILSTVLAAVVKQPPGGTNIGYGGDTYPFALDNITDESANAMSIFQALALSELGYIFVSREGKLVFQGRHRRPNLTVLSETLSGGDIAALDASRGREEIVNLASVQVHPRRVDDAATSVLFSLASVPEIVRGTLTEINAPYRDPNARATRVGGLDMVAPEPTTDYTFNTKEDGTGIDITSQLTLLVVYGGNTANVIVTNSGPEDGYLTKLQLRGKGVYSYETVFATAQHDASIVQYGESGFQLDMPYQHSTDVAQDAASFVVAQSKDILTQVRGVTFHANREDRLLQSALGVEIGERVRVEDEMLGTAGKVPIGETLSVSALEFFVNGVSLSIKEHGVIDCTWTLAPADAFNYWILERDGFTELDITTRLGYGSFIAGWVVDESELGVGTRVNE